MKLGSKEQAALARWRPGNTRADRLPVWQAVSEWAYGVLAELEERLTSATATAQR